MKGIASPSFKHGRYSKVLPKGLSTHYLRAQEDRDLLALREEVALVDARVAELLERATTKRAGDRVWAALEPLINQRRKLVESESRRMKDLHQMITLERAYALVAAYIAVVQRHVTDRAVLTLISEEFSRLTAGGDDPPDAAADGRPPRG